MFGRIATATILILLLTSGCWAWGQHHLMTRVVVKSLPWVQSQQAVTITSLTYTVDPINPDYVFPFKEGAVGGTTTAEEILAVYSDEPDWGPDQNLNISWQQKFMGGYTGTASRGYLHCHYPAGSFNIPVPTMPMGIAHKRAAQIFEIAKEAARKGDLYWALRFTAWTLHYYQDLTQTYHSTQTARLFYYKPWSPKEFVPGTTRITVNYHFCWEGYALYRLREELAGQSPESLVTALKKPEEDEIGNVGCYGKKVARKAHKQSKKVFKATMAFFGDKFKVPEFVLPTDEDLNKPGDGDAKKILRANMVEAFGDYARSTRSLVNLIQKHVLSPQEARRRELGKIIDAKIEGKACPVEDPAKAFEQVKSATR